MIVVPSFAGHDTVPMCMDLSHTMASIDRGPLPSAAQVLFGGLSERPQVGLGDLPLG